jgi:hypothetical protein
MGARLPGDRGSAVTFAKSLSFSPACSLSICSSRRDHGSAEAYLRALEHGRPLREEQSVHLEYLPKRLGNGHLWHCHPLLDRVGIIWAPDRVAPKERPRLFPGILCSNPMTERVTIPVGALICLGVPARPMLALSGRGPD